MRIELNQDALCMARRQVVKVSGGRGHTVVCHDGSVWVTQDGDPRDVVLGAGETFTLDRDGTALVQAFEAGAISLRRPAPKIRGLGLGMFLRAHA